MPTGLIDSNAVAERLGIAERTVRDLVYKRRIPFVKVGRALRFDPRAIDQWIARNTTEARP